MAGITARSWVDKQATRDRTADAFKDRCLVHDAAVLLALGSADRCGECARWDRLYVGARLDDRVVVRGKRGAKHVVLTDLAEIGVGRVPRDLAVPVAQITRVSKRK